MDLEYGCPLRPRRKQAVQDFLARQALNYDEGITYTVNLLDGDTLVGTGSLDGNICKCIAVDPAYQGEGLTATIVTELRREAFRRGLRHLFLYTKPKNLMLFEGLSFYPVTETADTLLMENVRGGVEQFVRSLEAPETDGTVGAIVANCNPFTLGHRYLVEQAAQACGLLHVFVLSEDKGMFPAADRLELVRQGVAGLDHVLVHPTGDYLISAATFPTYFIKDKERVPEIRCRMDLQIFSEHFAPALHITRRFVGEEPLCPVTAAYNRQMLDYLPKHGVEVTVIPRKEHDGAPISASRVRELLEQKNWDALRPLVPQTTFDYLHSHFGA